MQYVSLNNLVLLELAIKIAKKHHLKIDDIKNLWCFLLLKCTALKKLLYITLQYYLIELKIGLTPYINIY